MTIIQLYSYQVIWCRSETVIQSIIISFPWFPIYLMSWRLFFSDWKQTNLVFIKRKETTAKRPYRRGIPYLKWNCFLFPSNNVFVPLEWFTVTSLFIDLLISFQLVLFLVFWFTSNPFSFGICSYWLFIKLKVKLYLL